MTEEELQEVLVMDITNRGRRVVKFDMKAISREDMWAATIEHELYIKAPNFFCCGPLYSPGGLSVVNKDCTCHPLDYVFEQMKRDHPEMDDTDIAQMWAMQNKMGVADGKD